MTGPALLPGSAPVQTYMSAAWSPPSWLGALPVPGPMELMTSLRRGRLSSCPHHYHSASSRGGHQRHVNTLAAAVPSRRDGEGLGTPDPCRTSLWWIRAEPQEGASGPALHPNRLHECIISSPSLSQSHPSPQLASAWGTSLGPSQPRCSPRHISPSCNPHLHLSGLLAASPLHFPIFRIYLFRA